MYNDAMDLHAYALDLATRALSDANDRFAAGVDDNLPVVQAQATLSQAQSQLIADTLTYNQAKLGLARVWIKDESFNPTGTFKARGMAAAVSRAKELVKKGTPKDQLLAQIKTDDLGWNINTQQWQQPARLDPFYAELKAAK